MRRRWVHSGFAWRVRMACLVMVMGLLTACGGTGGGGAPAPSTASVSIDVCSSLVPEPTNGEQACAPLTVRYSEP